MLCRLISKGKKCPQNPFTVCSLYILFIKKKTNELVVGNAFLVLHNSKHVLQIKDITLKYHLILLITTNLTRKTTCVHKKYCY